MAVELLIAWLNDAYAVELAGVETLERMIDDFDNNPTIRSELRQHLAESQDQMSDIKDAIESLDGELKPVQSKLGEIINAAQELNTSPYHDEQVRDLQLLHATEQYEHIMYIAISEGARHIGEDEVADMCERIAEDEKAMAEWAEEQLPAVVTGCMSAAVSEE